MAKLRAGSIVRKGSSYYLVHRNKWIALKTKSYEEAEKRAVDFLPAIADPETEWLEHLIEIGERARQKLAARSQPVNLGWHALYDAWIAADKRLTVNQHTLRAYRGQLYALARFAAGKDIPGPAGLSSDAVAAYIATRSPEAGRRDCALFARIYRALNLDPSAWISARKNIGRPAPDRYRRIMPDEFAAILAAAPTQADRALLLLGYTTGMRLSTCLAIREDNITPGYIVIVPGKTRAAKPRPLTIPLLPAVAAALAQLAPAYFSGLRPDTTSNRLAKIFRSCGVASNQFGRASFHSLRATYISMMDEAGIPPHITDAITGHAAQGMHGRYSQPSRAALTAAVLKAVLPCLPQAGAS